LEKKYKQNNNQTENRSLIRIKINKSSFTEPTQLRFRKNKPKQKQFYEDENTNV